MQQLSSNLSGLLSSASVVENIHSVLSATSKNVNPSSYSNVITAKSSAISDGLAATIPPLKSHAMSMFHNSRNSNLILFGLPTTKSLPELKAKVDDMLQFLLGTSVPLKDLYRLCHKKSSPPNQIARPRPVILTFHSSFDRRLVLSSVRKLKDYSVKGLFVRADMPLDDRNKRLTATTKTSSQASVSLSTPPLLNSNTTSSQSKPDGGGATSSQS